MCDRSECRRSAKRERDGHWYCGFHDPVMEARRKELKRDRLAENRADTRLSVTGGFQSLHD
jgi:hypothetical protein